MILATEEALSGNTFTPPRLLILINPAGGKGNAESLFRKHVQPMFEMAEIKSTVIVTGVSKSILCNAHWIITVFSVERRNHAREVVKGYDLSSIDGIVIVSGDGLVHEVYYIFICEYTASNSPHEYFLLFLM